ncbi:MAG: hypothetical protein JWM05_3291 [Acidimicrobiales bacterium]|nr:hypothetical protein [Acidimicrobiales bacterium]
MTLEEYFATGPVHERPIFDAVMQHVATLGPVHVEPVSVGIFLKRAGRFATLRPMTKWVALSFWLPHQVRHPTITRKPFEHRGGYYYVANLREPADLDDALRDMLSEAYLCTPD